MGTTMLPDTTGRFGLTQLLDANGPEPALTDAQIGAEAQHIDSVWGAFQPQSWRNYNPRTILSRYMVPIEDDNLVSGHDLAWWQANHPDWILYACDSNGNPTTQLAWSGSGFKDVPLAFYLPEVQQYQMQILIPYLQAYGYNALAADNTNLTNYLLGGNPNFGQTYTRGDYGCGRYDTSGAFIRRYNGPGTDSQFAQDMIDWISATSNALHSSGLKLMINHPLSNPPTNTQESTVLSMVDGTLDESGFTDYGKYLTGSLNLATYVAQNIAWAEAAQQRHVAFLIGNYYCASGQQPWNGAPCSMDPNSLPGSLVDWSLASYAIVNEGGLNMYVSPDSTSNPSYRPEFSATYGAACSSYSQPSANVYTRRFQGGFAVLNANQPGTSMSIALPAGHTYTDVEGRPVSNPLTVNGADGYMLLTNNGCS